MRQSRHEAESRGTRVGVSVEEAGVQQLFEVADHSQIDQLLDVIGIALA